MKNNFTYLFALLICCCFAFCKKNDFPEPTTSGENTFGCYVNGEKWTPKSDPDRPSFTMGNAPVDAKFNPISSSMAINAVRHNNTLEQFQQIKFFLAESEEGETYSLDNYTSFTLRAFDCAYYYIDTTQVSSVTITRHDYDKKIISGTFEFVAVSQETCQDTIRISDGRFDLKYRI